MSAECQRCGGTGGTVLTWTADGGSHSRWICPQCVTRDEEKSAVMLKALRWIVQGRGSFDPEPHKFAANVIEEAIRAAKDAIEQVETKP